MPIRRHFRYLKEEVYLYLCEVARQQLIRDQAGVYNCQVLHKLPISFFNNSNYQCNFERKEEGV
jgi:hypothetical protein